jgi:hypothetical protein
MEMLTWSLRRRKTKESSSSSLSTHVLGIDHRLLSLLPSSACEARTASSSSFAQLASSAGALGAGAGFGLRCQLGPESKDGAF